MTLDYFKKFFLDFLYPRKDEPVAVTAEKLIHEAEKDIEFDGKNILAVFNYDDPTAKKLIWQLKYKGSTKAAKVLAEVLYQEILDAMEDWLAFEDFRNPIIVPTPASKEKLKLREYNQTEMIVREMEKLDEGKNFSAFYDLLEKKKDTPDQTSLKTKKARMSNLKGCFRVKNPAKIKGRNIIIIDDVVTTGATIAEIKKVLKKGGAKKIKAVTAAH